jgi:asparagine synthase (glutamine-hydrolysing)
MRNGRIETRRYWDVERFDDFGAGEAAGLEAIESHLDARVQERLESEVPIGAFLSGGIDSGLVVSAMSDAHRGRVVTTSVGFGDASHNELAPAGITAAHFGTDHHAHIVDPRLDEVLDSIVSAFDEPFADSSSVPTFYVSREARRHVTVALSGDGGDETFGGYDFRYIPHAMEARVRRMLPAGHVRRAVGTIGAGWPRSSRVPRMLRWGTYLENIGRDPAAAYFADLCFLKPAMAQSLVGGSAGVESSAVFETITSAYRGCPSPDPVQKAEYADLKIYLANDVLVKVDRMSMQHGLEVRCPLLDRRLVELAFSLPQSLKQAGRTGKHLLKQIARRRLPEALLRLPKRGFTAPVGAWIRGPYRARFEDEVLSNGAVVASLLDHRVIKRLADAHFRREADHAYTLWAIWMLERWGRAQHRVPVRDLVEAV